MKQTSVPTNPQPTTDTSPPAENFTQSQAGSSADVTMATMDDIDWVREIHFPYCKSENEMSHANSTILPERMGIRIPQLRLHGRAQRPRLQHERMARSGQQHHLCSRPFHFQPCCRWESLRNHGLFHTTGRSKSHFDSVAFNAELAEIQFSALSAFFQLRGLITLLNPLYIVYIREISPWIRSTSEHTSPPLQSVPPLPAAAAVFTGRSACLHMRLFL